MQPGELETGALEDGEAKGEGPLEDGGRERHFGATGAPVGGAAFPLMLGGFGEAIFSPALLALLPPGTRLELVYNPVPS
ncbi:MAG TPA: hypothetical protein VFN74_11200, partial [Chloroflexota bacterium]|nr:hypothetical protein [Chloroflexota bacterium]